MNGARVAAWTAIGAVIAMAGLALCAWLLDMNLSLLIGARSASVVFMLALPAWLVLRIRAMRRKPAPRHGIDGRHRKHV